MHLLSEFSEQLPKHIAKIAIITVILFISLLIRTRAEISYFFLKKEKQCIKPIFVNGIYKEELFDFFLKFDLKDQVDDKSYKQIKFPTYL